MFASEEPLSRWGFILAVIAVSAVALASATWAFQSRAAPVVLPEPRILAPILLIVASPLIAAASTGCAIAALLRGESRGAWATALSAALIALIFSVVFALVVLLYAG